MSKSKRIKCTMFLVAVAMLGSSSVCQAQSDGLGNTMPDGGLRGPQDIINSTNARDAYGNARPQDGGGYNPPAYNAAPAPGPEPGSIRPFTQGPSGYAPNGGGYPGAPAGYPGGPGAQSAYPGAPPGYVPNQPPYTPKHHSHHHHQSNQYATDPSAGVAPGVAGAPGAPNMSGPPGAAYPSSRGGGGGNSSLAGAAVGLPDRAGKTAVGVSGKAAKEVLKAIF